MDMPSRLGAYRELTWIRKRGGRLKGVEEGIEVVRHCYRCSLELGYGMKLDRRSGLIHGREECVETVGDSPSCQFIHNNGIA